MRNSHEFPKWLNAPETKEKLKNKTVMVSNYCALYVWKKDLKVAIL